jgi:hypothetical protein
MSDLGKAFTVMNDDFHYNWKCETLSAPDVGLSAPDSSQANKKWGQTFFRVMYLPT